MSFDGETPPSSTPGTPIPHNGPSVYLALGQSVPLALGHPVPMTPSRCDALDYALTQWSSLLRSYCSACEVVVSCLRHNGITIILDSLLDRTRHISGRLAMQASHYARRSRSFGFAVSVRTIYRDWFIFWNCVGLSGVYQGVIARDHMDAMLEMRDSLWIIPREQLDPVNALVCIVKAAELLEQVNDDLTPLLLGV